MLPPTDVGETVTVAFLAWSVEMSLVLLVFIVLFTGIVIGWSLSSYLRFARHRAQNRQREKVTTEAMTKQKLSARGFHNVLRVAQTIADLERSETLQRHHVLEALSYRGVLLSGPLPG